MEDNNKYIKHSYSLDMSENAVTIWIVTVAGMVIGALLLLFCAIGEMNTRTDIEAIRSGLVQKPNFGSSGSHWDKP